MKSHEINDQLIGQRIFLARHDQHMTQSDLAEQTNLSLSHIKSIESGHKRCSIDALARLCAALEVSADYILFGQYSGDEELSIVCDYLERHLNDLKRTLNDPRFLK